MLLVPESSLPSLAYLENPRSTEATVLYSSDAKVLGSYYVKNRSNLKYQELPENLVNALIATEDERYYNHSGVDATAIGRAVFSRLIGKNAGGGSTITQQLAKMMFHERPSNSWKRIRQKAAEWIIAGRLEKRYTKEEIIAMYFNEFDFIQTGCGINSAARVYLNKRVHKLNLQECAMFVGMFKNPVYYNPITHPERCKKRREVVLNQMRRNGFISDQIYDSVRVLPMKLDFHPETSNTGLAPYFRDFVRGEIKRVFKRNNIVTPEGNDYDLYRDGLKIYTTVDSRMQRYAEWAVAKYIGGSLQSAFEKDIKSNARFPFGRGVNATEEANSIRKAMQNSDRYKSLKKLGKSEKEILDVFKKPVKMKIFDWKAKRYEKEVKMSPLDSIRYYKQILRVGMVSLDPSTGFVKAWVGGPNYKYLKFDGVKKTRRQIGSTIKPFVFGTAIENGIITPCTSFPNSECCIDYISGEGTKSWCPRNAGVEFDGVETPCYFALASSWNNITAKVVKESGGQNQQVIQLFEDMGLLNNTFVPVPSLGLGICDLSVYDLTSAYGIFLNEGFYVKPKVIVRVEDRHGRVLYEPELDIKEVMDKKAAFDVLRMLSKTKGTERPADKKKGGTARRLSGGYDYSFKYPMAGKTGTTQNSADGWFIGITPDLVTGVWVGGEEPIIRFNSGWLGQGAHMALPIWGYYMNRVYKDSRIKIDRGHFVSAQNMDRMEFDCEDEIMDWN